MRFSAQNNSTTQFSFLRFFGTPLIVTMGKNDARTSRQARRLLGCISVSFVLDHCPNPFMLLNFKIVLSRWGADWWNPSTFYVHPYFHLSDLLIQTRLRNTNTSMPTLDLISIWWLSAIGYHGASYFSQFDLWIIKDTGNLGETYHW